MQREVEKVLMTRVLSEFAKVGVIGVACDNVKVRRAAHNRWLQKYPKYKELYEELKERFVDGLESVAIQRAKEKSDSLLMFLLKAERREKYGDRTEINGNLPSSQITLLFSEGMLNDEEKKLLEDAQQQAREKLGGKSNG
ncbi:MAG: hypothetical protein HF312_17120 [Ignavibacteria bacterium]|nr:hypothetical protein [Ignavibacteria bacterium]